MTDAIKRRLKRLRRRQLDAALDDLFPLAKTKVPPDGWIAEIRKAIGMSAAQLASRLGIARPSVVDIENGEIQRTVTLKTLDKAAAALGCRVVYALVPQEPLEVLVQKRANAVAARIFERVSHSMALEDQKVSKAERERQIKDLADDLVRTLPRQLWSEE